MRLRKALKILLVGIAIAVVAVAVLHPYDRTYYRCPYCAAWADRVHVLVVPMRLNVHEGLLSQYWRREVDREHRHTWVAVAQHGPQRIADYSTLFRVRWSLIDEVAIAVLKSLPDRQSRESLIDSLWKADSTDDPARYRKAEKAIRELTETYLENPKRRDWPAILRKLDLRPRT